MKKFITIISITFFSIISFACMTVEDFSYGYVALEAALEYELSTCSDDVSEINANTQFKRRVDRLVASYESNPC